MKRFLRIIIPLALFFYLIYSWQKRTEPQGSPKNSFFLNEGMNTLTNKIG
jgi:hypothetical protein